MLKTLEIENLILVDCASLTFGKGLNVLTGETGSGKSAILAAIGLLMGDRGDAGLVGMKKESAVVRAEFVLERQPFEVRREIDRSGKSKCWIEGKAVPVAMLKTIVKPLIECVDQSSAQMLFDTEVQRDLLDTASGCKMLATGMQTAFGEWKEQEGKLEACRAAKSARDRELAWASEDLSFLEEHNWKEDEEASLSQEHARLANAQELIQKAEAALQALEGSRLAAALPFVESSARLDARLKETAATLKSAHLEVQEVVKELASYLNRLELNPNRLEAIEARLAAIEQIKRRFSSATWAEVQAAKQKLQEKVDRLQNLEEEERLLQQFVEEKFAEVTAMAETLSSQRKKGALHFACCIMEELTRLNFPHAVFQIQMSKCPLASHGKDCIEFLFSANLGQEPVSLKECASGGELSRLLFAMKKILAHHEKNVCLIFDEIDGNVGGQTAAILGEELQKIGLEKQVICITHFKQVAVFAEDHFIVAKEDVDGKTISTIQKLSDADKVKEYARMLGMSPSYTIYQK